MSDMTTANLKRFRGRLEDATVVAAYRDDVGAYRIDGRTPQVVAYPNDARELGRLMAAANECDVAVAPWGGGTRTELGNPPERLDAVVDLSRLNRVVMHSPADLTATVEAGITVGSLQAVLGEHGQFVSLDPPLPDRATVGGSLAAGGSGPLKWQYGSPRDIVIGMRVVSADGTATKSGGRTVKNVSGYDMAKLHIGGLGTLGIIAEVTFKLTSASARQATLIAAYESSRQCVRAALGIFHSDVVPLALATFDANANRQMATTDLAGRYFLAVRLAGRPVALGRKTWECQAVCRRHGPTRVEVLGEGDGASMWRDIADFGWAGEPTPTVLGRAFVLPSAVGELVDAIERLGSYGGLQPAALAQPAYGTVLIGWYAAAEAASADEAAGALRSTIEAVHQVGGRMVVERCPPGIKSHFDIWDDVGGALAVMRRLKEQYDPKRILNPGRFAGGI